MDAIESWVRFAPLWSGETVAGQAEKWLDGEHGQAFLVLKASQVNPLRDLLIQTRTLDALGEAIQKLGGSAADHGKSPWNRKDKPPGLRTALTQALNAAIEISAADGSEESQAFAELVKQAGSERALEIRKERELRIRKQFLLFVIEGYQARKSKKGEQKHGQREPGVAEPAEPLRDSRGTDRGRSGPRGKRLHGRG